MAKHYDLFHWTLIEALRLRTNPTNLLRYCLWVNLERMYRIQNGGVSPSPFFLNFAAVMTFEATAKHAGHAPTPSPSRIAQIEADGGIGEGVVLFLIGGRCQVQYHTIMEIPPGSDSPGDAGWKSVVKGVVNGDIPISSLSRMIEGSDPE
ncbi:hypothetical protein FB451DRAFT_151998 [Mycena latifolia]|nr:hypothetical protein FB451DRAFT_151998 [Mycena latifolia]